MALAASSRAGDTLEHCKETQGVLGSCQDMQSQCACHERPPGCDAIGLNPPLTSTLGFDAILAGDKRAPQADQQIRGGAPHGAGP